LPSMAHGLLPPSPWKEAVSVGMADRIVARILPEHFETFKKLMPKDQRLGKTYGEWIARRAEEAKASSVPLTEVTVTPEEFEVYCVQLAQVPNYFVLETLAAKKARENR
jgi:hypothetical protein